MITGTVILSKSVFEESQIEVSAVFAVAIILTGPGSVPLFSETVAIPLTDSTFTLVTSGEFKYVPAKTGSSRKFTVTGVVNKFPLLS